MRHPRRYRSLRRNGNSYFTDCYGCGERIHMREMPYGQWVAFDGPDSVHHCGQPSEYEDDPSTSTRPSGGRNRGDMVPSVSSPAESRNEAGQQPRSPLKSGEEGWPAWVWWLIVIMVLYFLLKK